jgi:outer membrane receptor for ferric coprogen and ferric-rhodotorulic acid
MKAASKTDASGAMTPLAAVLLLLLQTAGVQASEASSTTSATDADTTTSEPRTLSKVEVHSQRKTSGVAKFKLPSKDVPQALSIIERDRIEQQNLFNLDELMQQATGVTVRPYVQLTTSYSLRGFQIDAFEQNGVPILLGNTASAPQDMAMYERVEILRGATGLMHGTGNPAATVNLVTKRAPDMFNASAMLAAGSWDRYRVEADVGSPLNANGNLRGRVVASHEDRHYFYDVADQQRSSMFGVAELDVAADGIVSVGVNHQRIRSVPSMAGVGWGSDGNDLQLPRSSFLDVDWGKMDWDTTRAFLQWEQPLGSDWRLKAVSNHYRSEADILYAGAYGTVDRNNGDGAILYAGANRVDSSQNSVDAFVSGGFNALGRRHELILGGNLLSSRSETYNGSLDTRFFQSINIYDWDPGSVAKPGVTGYSSSGATRTRQSGFYAAGRLRLADPLTLTVGGRLSQWRQRTASARNAIDDEFTPYAGLVWALTKQWSLYASYTDIFQPQNYQTWSGQLLDPVIGVNYEAGVKAEFLDGQLDLAFAVFTIRQENRAQQDPDHPCVGTLCYYIADGKVESKGLELEISGRPNTTLSLSAGYTYNRTEYIDDASYQGQVFARYAPRQILRLWGDYTLPWQQQRWSTGFGLQAQSEFSNISSGITQKQGGYVLFNARLACRLNERINIAVNVNNLFDRRYYQSFFGPQWSNRYGEPRSLMLTVRARY